MSTELGAGVMGEVQPPHAKHLKTDAAKAAPLK
jgi:hypothetical protein